MSSLATAAVLTFAPWATRCLATLEPRQAQWLDSFGFCQFTYPGSLGDIKNYSCCLDAQGAKVIKQLDCFRYCQCTCLGSLGNTNKHACCLAAQGAKARPMLRWIWLLL